MHAIELSQVQVSREQVFRVAGYPADYEVPEASLRLLSATEDWCQREAKPVFAGTRVDITHCEADTIKLGNGLSLNSPLLARRLRRTKAKAGIVVAISLGWEYEDACSKLWEDGLVDEAFFRDSYGTVLMKALLAKVREGLSEAYAPQIVLPHYSPGYDGWDLADQQHLYRSLFPDEPSPALSCDADTGALMPSRAMLAFFTLNSEGTPPRQENCSACGLTRCVYRGIF